MLRLRFSIAPILVVLAILAFGSAQERRATWDPASFLQRLDRNGNAVLEPDEMAGRAKGFIEKLGIDASGPVAIENVMNTINRQRQQADQDLATQDAAAKASSTEWSTPRLIPGFGEAVETPTLPGFGLPAGASTAVTAEAKPEAVGDSVIAQVDRVLSQYDPNKDLVLDATEIQPRLGVHRVHRNRIPTATGGLLAQNLSSVIASETPIALDSTAATIVAVLSLTTHLPDGRRPTLQVRRIRQPRLPIRNVPRPFENHRLKIESPTT